MLQQPQLHPVVVEARPAAERARGPSVFTNGYRGLLTGALVGVSAGYLLSRDEGRDAWPTVALGAGIGALSGAGLGLALGLFDLAGDKPQRAHLALRDTLYGTTFGAVAGVVAGSLFVLRTEDPEDAVFGASVGALSGAGLGLVIGVIDGVGVMQRDDGRRYVPAVTTTTDAHGTVLVAPAVAGRF